MMLAADPQTDKASLMVIEGGLTLITAAVAFGWPMLGAQFFSRIEKAFGQLARRRGLAVLVVGVATILLRLAILPRCPIPSPFVPDDFSFLLAADTFISGRLTNPTPPMWTHFETMHVTMKPTYMSMYFPAQGVILAAAKLLTGHPWYGVLLMSALMCAAICWMLQAWLPPTWALLGGILAILHICLFSYWINTYTGAGSIAAFAGALVLGALPRFMKDPRLRYSLLMGIGIVLLATTRPYEGLLLCLPVAVVLGHWFFGGKNRPTPAVLLRVSAAPLALILAVGAWMGYYNYRAFGNPLTPPYASNRSTYAIVPYFVWQSLRSEPAYRHEIMRRFYHEHELVDYDKIHGHFFYQSLIKALGAALFFAGIALLPALTDVSPGADGPSHPFPGCVSGGHDGRHRDTDISDSALSGSVHGRLLRAWFASDATPAAYERRRPAGRTRLGTYDSDTLCCAGWPAVVCRTSSSRHSPMADV